MDTIARRIERLHGDTGHPVFTGLAERLERLRERHISGAEESQQFLQDLLDLTRQVQAADKAVDGNPETRWSAASGVSLSRSPALPGGSERRPGA